MSLETFQRCLSNVPAHVQIMFAGMAEPWLNPHATDMLLLCRQFGHKISVYSTLVGMTVADVERLEPVVMEHLCIHLPDADGVMKHKLTDQWFETLAAVSARLKHHFVVFGRLHPRVQEIVGPVRDDSPGLLSRAGNLPSRMIPFKTGALTCTACGPKIDHNVLLPNGDVTLCCMTYSLQHVLGNLTTQTWDSLFESEEYKRVMRGLDGDETVDIACRRCEMAASK